VQKWSEREMVNGSEMANVATTAMFNYAEWLKNNGYTPLQIYEQLREIAINTSIQFH
jgi:hypothetical protein